MEPIFPKPTDKDVLRDITAFITSELHEDLFENELNQRKLLVDKLENLAKDKDLTEEDLVFLLREDDNAVNTMISILGMSQEEFLRIITLLRTFEGTFDREWKINTIVKKVKTDRKFARTVAKLFLSGKDNPLLRKHVPRFSINKLDKNKLLLKRESLIDSLIRSGLKGRYDALKGKVVEREIEKILIDLNTIYLSGDVEIPYVDRRMDFVIPSLEDPHIFIECGIFITTARELSEKGLVEMRVRRQVEEHYPSVFIVRVLDGIGWIARGGQALQKVIDASHYVLTMKKLEKLRDIVRNHVPRKYFRSTLNNFKG